MVYPYHTNLSDYSVQSTAERYQIREQGKRVGLLLLLIVGANIVLGLAASLGMAVLSGGSVENMTKGLLSESNPVATTCAQGVMYLVYMLLPLIITLCVFRVPLRTLSGSRDAGLGDSATLIFLGLGGCVFANITTSVLMNILQKIGVPIPDTSLAMDSSVSSYLINILVIAVLPCIIEEMIFRGFILSSLRPYGDGFAILVSALCFGLMHMNLSQIPFAFILGIVFGYAVVKTGSLLTGMVLHFFNNFFSVTIEYFSKNLPENMVNSMVWSVYAVIVLVALIVLLVQHNRKPGLLTPVSNGTSVLPLGKRVGAFLQHPVLLVALVLMVGMTVLGVVEQLIPA